MRTLIMNKKQLGNNNLKLRRRSPRSLKLVKSYLTWPPEEWSSWFSLWCSLSLSSPSQLTSLKTILSPLVLNSLIYTLLTPPASTQCLTPMWKNIRVSEHLLYLSRLTAETGRRMDSRWLTLDLQNTNLHPHQTPIQTSLLFSTSDLTLDLMLDSRLSEPSSSASFSLEVPSSSQETPRT